ncbi:glycosyltransferase family 2 protein [Arthrobacter sp. B1I2]|uniref:glycosyltransferase family 2 protein n=1 Tax=Arthrobacter sp. B1I2 TaxID=3042263 RepID=UPI0027827EED|nr:glycosyltransferase family 2 protein [Arthrobacter sp. B1I2]MDQ0731127.1 GT2 family glycosyltransferase [Arthrobacter sp. B1I2]
MDSQVSTCIIILNWNSAGDVIQCLGHIDSREWDILIVDNASSDSEEAESIKLTFPAVHLLKNSTNLGYAGGMNSGMRWAKENGYSSALLLNPDTKPTLELIRSMINASKEASVVGTAQVSPDGAGVMVPYVSAATLRGDKPISYEWSTETNELVEVDIVTGAAILVDLSEAARINYMDEQFFHYKEEYDFAFRMRKAGNRIVFVSEYPLVHERGGSLPLHSAQAVYYNYRNELLFLRKHFGIFGFARGPGIFRDAVRHGFNSPRLAVPIVLGLFHGLRGVTGPVTLRSGNRTS